MNFHPESMEEERIAFINACILNDTPRLKSETYPEDVRVLSDIPYGDKTFGYDVYLPEGTDQNAFSEAFFMIHGGAFVYGVKENNKLFGTHLARISGIPVVNIDYPLLPDVELINIFEKILDAADSVCERFGVNKFHLTGDSAGGYLSFVSGLIMYSDEMSSELKLTKKHEYQVKSLSPLCGCYCTTPEEFPSFYFEKSKAKILPDYIYDVGIAVKRFGAPSTFIITGEEDFLRSQNEYLKEVFEKEGIPFTYYMGENKDGRVMSHIFPIPNPLWPESLDVIEKMILNAKN